MSTPNEGVTLAIVPDAPINLAEDASLRSATTLGLTWIEGAYNGGSPVLDYKVSMATASGSFSVLDSAVISLPYTVTGLTVGTSYEFKV